MNTSIHERRNARRHPSGALPRILIALLIGSSLAHTQAACGGGKIDAPHSDAAGDAARGASTAGDAPDVKVASNVSAADAVKVEVAPIRLARGGSADGIVRVVVAPGFHVNANPATHSYLIPTALSVTGEAGVTASAPTYPEGVTRKFAFDSAPLRVYEGATEIKLGLQATRDAAAGAKELRVRVRVQPCDDAVCHPPRTLEAGLPVTIE